MSASLRPKPGASYRRYAIGYTLRVLLQYTGITVVDYVTIKLHRDIILHMVLNFRFVVVRSDGPTD